MGVRVQVCVRVCECVRVCACASAWQHRGTAGKLEVRWESVCRCLVSEREREKREVPFDRKWEILKKEGDRKRESVCACV